MNITATHKTITCLLAVAAAGWGAHEWTTKSFASSEALRVAETKVSYILSIQLENLVRQAAFLEAKPNKTAEEINQLNYLRKQIDDARKVQQGK